MNTVPNCTQPDPTHRSQQQPMHTGPPQAILRLKECAKVVPCNPVKYSVKEPKAGMHWKGGRYSSPPPGRPAYAQPLSP